jgi:hypothetical protein
MRRKLSRFGFSLGFATLARPANLRKRMAMRPIRVHVRAVGAPLDTVERRWGQLKVGMHCVYCREFFSFFVVDPAHTKTHIEFAADEPLDTLCPFCGRSAKRNLSDMRLRRLPNPPHIRTDEVLPVRQTKIATRPYPSVGRCIYCYATKYCEDQPNKKLGEEHIIPAGLGGRLILPEASCHKCETMNNSAETFCQNNMLEAFRLHLGITRSGAPHKSLRAEFLQRDGWHTHKISASRCPVIMMVPTLPAPDVFFPHPPERSNVLQFTAVTIWSEKEILRLLHDFDAIDWRIRSKHTRLKPFVRMLAKIAHAYCVAELGLGGFHPLLLPIIRGEFGYPGHRFVGGTANIPDKHTRHELDLQRERHGDRMYWIVRIRMFSDLGFPEYICAAGLDLCESDTTISPLAESDVRPFRMPRPEISTADRVPRPAPQIWVHPKGDALEAAFSVSWGNFKLD